jgi:hypothetical protein
MEGYEFPPEDSFGPPDEKPDYYSSHKDSGKLPVMLVPPETIESIATGFQYGLKKGYAESSWKQTPDGLKRYSASVLRHFLRFWSGETIDPESGLPHLTLMLTDAAIVEWLWRKQNVARTENDSSQ